MGRTTDTDLLRALLDFKPETPNSPDARIAVTTISGSCIVMHGCTVTIHQPITASAEPPL